MIVQEHRNEKALMAATIKAKNEKPNTQLGNSLMNNTTLSTEIQNVSNFNFGESSIRVVSINNEPWFIAKDICEILGIKNPTQALENLDEDERAMFNIGLDQRVNFDNRVSEINIVSESGMYTLILRCRDAVKKGSVPHRFRKWVTSEVLPQIRKTGKYEKLDTPILLTKEHQQFIKDFVKNRTLQLPKDKQAKCAIMQWSALKSHFGKSYKEIDDSQFVDAISLLARLPLEGELIDSSTLQLSKNSQNTEATLEIMVELYGYCLHAYEMQEKLSQYPDLADRIDSKIGGQYLHNLKHPLENAMTKAKRFIRNNSEKLTIIKAVDHLLN
ncbi:Bro-N domain-containing protein [Gallibacterium anatis]|uniref:BRO-N domain-containing protein n=1 Tax=Gallibacterium anatis TaxID=750 RepID=UPI000A428C7C|nr:Bro-N domain-containing protein [Gallibacterium anatis]